MVHKLAGDSKLQGKSTVKLMTLKGGKIMEGNQTNNQTQTNTQNNQNNGTAAENGQQNGAVNSQQSGGEKTFTQADVDRIVQERLARANKPATQNTQQPVETPAVDAQIAEVRSQYVGAKVESVMATSGIKPEKIERAARLVDKSKCVDKDGNPDTEKIKTEIEELLKDFPELKTTTEEGSAGFKFGANSGSGTTESEVSSKVSAIFGNKK